MRHCGRGHNRRRREDQPQRDTKGLAEQIAFKIYGGAAAAAHSDESNTKEREKGGKTRKKKLKRENSIFIKQNLNFLPQMGKEYKNRF